jgi:transposase
MSTTIQPSRTDQQRQWAEQFPVHVGVDTGKTRHALVVRPPDRLRRPALRVPMDRAGFEAAESHIRSLSPSTPPEHVLVGFEFAGHHGFTFADFLWRKGYRVVSVLAAVTKATKGVEQGSRNKSDDIDATQICKLVGDGLFVRFPFLETPYLELKLLVAHRHRLTVEATRLKNRLQGLLDLAWPEFVPQFSGIQKPTPRAILARWPVPADLLASSPRTVAAEIHRASRGHVGPERVRALLASARDSVGLQDALEERRLEIRQLLARWDLLDHQLDDLGTRIEALVEQCPEAKLLCTVPEVSAVCAATLVTELGRPQDFEHYRQVLKLAGLQLAGRESGQSVGRRRVSKHGRPLLRRHLYLLAGRWCQSRGLYRAEYLAMRARGVQGTKAVCTLSRKLVPLLFAILQRGEPFDGARFEANRRRSELPPSVRQAGRTGAVRRHG